MDEQTRKALEDSIAHWERNVERAGNGEAISVSPYACALCKEFATGQPRAEKCSGCPVAQRAGNTHCRETPYTKVAFMYTSEDWTKETLTEACQAELDFLRSLLPHG